VGAPTLATWALSSALAARPAPGDLATVATVRGILGDDAARWRDPAWQRRARQRLTGLHVDVLLDDAAGHQVFATPGAPALLQWWIARVGQLSPSTALRSARVVYRTPPPTRLLTTLPLYTTHLAGHARSGTSTRVGIASVLVGIAYVWLVPSATAPRPPVWLVPAAGLAALLVALAVVAWGLRRLVLRPLAAMSRAADQIAGGNLDVRLPLSRAREVAEVAAALAGMSAALRAALQRQAALEEERRLFIGAIVHDLHTPLFVLRGYLQGLENGVATTPQKVAAYVAECRTRVDALARLIADLFAYTKVEYLDQALQQEPLDLGALLRQTMAVLQPLAAEKDLVVTLEGPDAPCPLVGDRHLLTRAVENLVDNALRHTPAGGEIRVSWGAEGTQLVVRVADTGPGIAAHDVPHLFTPLYRGESSRNRQTGGAGLGLAIARRILQAHGGDLTAANRTTGGAVFTMTLPAGRQARAPADPVTATAE
jgi:signal transduction histidine kinase